MGAIPRIWTLPWKATGSATISAATCRPSESELTPEGYPVELKVNDQKTVHSAFVRFPGLLYDLGLSGQRSEVLAVKLEVDTNPPAGAGLATTVVRRLCGAPASAS